LEVVVFVDEAEAVVVVLVVEVVVVEPELALRTAWNSFQATENKSKRLNVRYHSHGATLLLLSIF
jgi:hypothetical protein